MEKVRKLTVSEFIRESKPDWKQVSVRYKHADTGTFSGPLTVNMPNEHSWSFLGKPCIPDSFAEQVEHQLKQISGEEPLITLYGEETKAWPEE